MNIADLLPTRKVTAFLLGAAAVIVALWLLVDVTALLEEWPETQVLVALTILTGFVLAWIVPEGAWTKVGQHTDPDA